MPVTLRKWSKDTCIFLPTDKIWASCNSDIVEITLTINEPTGLWTCILSTRLCILLKYRGRATYLWINKHDNRWFRQWLIAFTLTNSNKLRGKCTWKCCLQNGSHVVSDSKCFIRRHISHLCGCTSGMFMTRNETRNTKSQLRIISWPYFVVISNHSILINGINNN